MFSRIFIERPRLALVISLVMVLAGAISLQKLPVAEYPEIAPPQVRVSAMYTGASAQVVADTVALPIESELNGVDDLLYYSSTCDNSGNFDCAVTFKTGTNDDIAMVNVQNAIKRAEAKLPVEVTRMGVDVAKRSSDMLSVFTFLAASDDDSSLLALNNYVNQNIKDAVVRVDGVAQASIFSSQVYSMRLWMDPFRMNGLGISVHEVMDAVSKQNVQAAAGNIGSEASSPYLEYKINVQGRLTTPEEFENIVIRNDGEGAIVRVKDIARVELGSESYPGYARYQGRKCVGMAIYRNNDANALATVNQVKKLLEDISHRFPEGVSYHISYDPTEFIMISLHEIVETLIVALILVVVITYLFLQDWRATLVPTVAIPVAIFGTFPFMLAFGYSINVLTMFGLILVIGSLVDDAIVVVENSQSLMEREHLDSKAAATKCMEQITGAIIATTLVTVACYAPIAFYGGMVGMIYRQFSMTMCISLCLSTVVAMTLSPAMCSLFLRPPKDTPSKAFLPFNICMDFSRKIYLGGVHFLVRHSVLTMILLCCVICVGWWLNKQIPSSFLPKEDKGAILCNIEMPSGATVERTNPIMERILEIVRSEPGVENFFGVNGYSFMGGAGENNGLGFIQLTDWEERKTPDLSLENIQKRLQQKLGAIPEARIICFTPPAIMGLGVANGASAMIAGEGFVDPEELSDVAWGTVLKIASRPDVIRAYSSYTADTPQIELQIDREKAEMLGVSVSAIFSTLQCQLASFYVNDFNYQGDTFKVKIQANRENRMNIEDIEALQILNDHGELVPFSSIGTVGFKVGPRRIQRFNKMTAAEINVEGDSTLSSSEVMKLMEKAHLPKQFHLEWFGMSYQEKQNEGQIVFLMILALLFAYLFLVAQYESWSIPLPIMMTVTFAITGALGGLYLMKESLSIYAQLGLVMLIGLSAKNAILMVEFSKQMRESGQSVEKAAMSGADLRFRAVLMTALSFLFGVFPLVIARGAGAGSRHAIGLTTFSGMMLATFVGIFFTPALYAAVQRVREFVKRILHIAPAKGEEVK